MLYLKLVFNEFKNANHDKRELSVAKEMGFEVFVVGTTKECHDFLMAANEGYPVYRISTRWLGNANWMKPLNRVIAFFRAVLKARRMNADIISGHDYIATLAAYIANLFKSKKAKIVYDSHEFELYRTNARSKLALWGVKQLEGFLLHRVDLSLMVGDKIADGVQEIYKLKKRPTVVRNIRPYWHLDPEKTYLIRKEFLRMLGLTKLGCLLMWHGGIVHGRGIEYAIRALSMLPNTGLVVMGNERIPGTVEYLRKIATEEELLDRILFIPAVPIEELKDYAGAVDVELVIQEPLTLSYLYALPNKFFESIQSGVPLICCDYPEMGEIIRQYDIGLLVQPRDSRGIAEAVSLLREDKALYNRFKKNLEKAKEELCWENEREKLKRAIREMMEAEKDGE